MKRQKAREYMMTVLFQMDALDEFDIDERDRYLKKAIFGQDTIEKQLGKQQDYCESVYSLACNKIKEIDQTIEQYSRKWKLKRTPKVDLAIMRLAVLEMLYLKDIPASVSINEAVELAKKYCDENSPSYINGILGSLARNIKE